MIQFGPEWLRNLSMEGNSSIVTNTAASVPSGLPINQQKNAGGVSNTSSPAGSTRFQLAEYRYGREEMLALFDKDLEPPQELKDFESIYVERGHIPFALKSPNYEEEQLQPTSTSASRPWPRVPGQAPRPGTLSGEAGRAGRGRGRPHTGAVAPVTTAYSQPQRWNETSNWRRHVAKGEEEPTEEVWRPSDSSPGAGVSAGTPAMRYPVPRASNHNEKWDRDWQNDRAAARSSWHASRRTGSGEMQNSDDLLPEWALEGNFSEGGTFDSHGAFHGTTDDIPTSRPANSAETAYGLTRSHTSGNMRAKEETPAHWWSDYHQNKQLPAKKEEPKKAVSVEPVVTIQNYKKLVSPFTGVVKKKKSDDDGSSSSDAEMSPFMPDIRSLNLEGENPKGKRYYDNQSQKAETDFNRANNTVQDKQNNKEQVHIVKENGGDVQEVREEYRIYHTSKQGNNETKRDEPNTIKQKLYDGANKAAATKNDIKRAHSMYEVETKQEPLNMMNRESTIPINMNMAPPPNFIPNMTAVPNNAMGQGLPITSNPPPGSLPNVYMPPQQYSMYQVQQLQQMQNSPQAPQNNQRPIQNLVLPTQDPQPVQNLLQPVNIAQQIVRNTELSPSDQLIGQNSQQLQNVQMSQSAQLMAQNSHQLGHAQKAGPDAQLPTMDAQNPMDQAELPEWKRLGWAVPQTRHCPDAWFYEDPLKNTQGPFTSLEMMGWYLGGFFKTHLMVRRANEPEMRYLGSLGVMPPFLSDVAQGRAGSQALDPNLQQMIDTINGRRGMYPPAPRLEPPLPAFAPTFGSPVGTSLANEVAVPLAADTQILQTPPASALPRPTAITAPPQIRGDRTVAYSSSTSTQRIMVPPQHNMQRAMSIPASVNGSSSITSSSREPASGFVRQMSSAPISTVESLWAQQPAFPWTSDLTPTPKPTSMWGDIRPTGAPGQDMPAVPVAELPMDHQMLEEQMFAAARAQHLAGLTSGSLGLGIHNEANRTAALAHANKAEKENKQELGAGMPPVNLPGGFKLQHVSAIEAQVLERSKLENYNKFKPKMDEIPRLEAIESQSQRLMSAVVGQAHADMMMMMPNQFIQPDPKPTSVTPTKQAKVKVSKDDKKEDKKKKDDEVKAKRKVEETSSPLKTKKETDKPKKETEKEKKEIAEKLAKEGFIEVRSPSENRQNKDKRKIEIVKEMELKKKEEELLLKRQAEALEKMQRAQEMQLQQEQQLQLVQPVQPAPAAVARKAPWSAACNTQGPALAEIQRLEREKKLEQMREQQLMEQILAQQQQLAMAKEQETQVGWANKSLASNSATVKSLAEIQAEEARSAQANAAREAQAREGQAREERSKAPAGAAAQSAAMPWMQQPTLHNGGEQRMRVDRPRAGDIGGFWEGSTPAVVSTKQERAKAAGPSPVQTSSRAEPKKRTKAAKEPQEQKDAAAAAVTKFDTWSTDALTKWSAMIDVPTFLGFLKDIESPYDIKEYVKCYLGDSKETAEFARQFLEKRYRMLRADAPVDDLCSPAPALSPLISSDFQEVKSKGKKTKKNKMQKVDLSILGFSVTASEDRINVGDIDSV